MEDTRMVKNQILIDADPARVWQVLTDPAYTRQYMFGCAPQTDWHPGSELLWKGIFNGTELVAVKGNVLEIEPEAYLSYTTFDPNASTPDIPENYLTVTYRLQQRDGQTELFVTQGDFAKVADGDKRFQDAYNQGDGWNPILVRVKQLAEH